MPSCCRQGFECYTTALDLKLHMKEDTRPLSCSPLHQIAHWGLTFDAAVGWQRQRGGRSQAVSCLIVISIRHPFTSWPPDVTIPPFDLRHHSLLSRTPPRTLVRSVPTVCSIPLRTSPAGRVVPATICRPPAGRILIMSAVYEFVIAHVHADLMYAFPTFDSC